MATDVREFQSRTSTGVRGVRLAEADEVISMSILHRVGTNAGGTGSLSPLRSAGRARRTASARFPQSGSTSSHDKEQFILTITENGYGKRSSAYEYRRTNRGGQGITNIDTSRAQWLCRGELPAHQGEQLMLVTDQGKMIRTTVGSIRIAGRNTMGVTIFRVADDEHVVSVAKIDESEEEDVEIDGGDEKAPVEDAVIGESELEKPVDPEQE